MSRTPAIAALIALTLLCVPVFGLSRASAGSELTTTLTASPSTVPPNFPVSFTYTEQPSSATPSGTSITSATIDYGDGKNFFGGSAGPDQPVSGTASHVYSDPGTYTAIFKAEGSDGEIGTSSEVVTVSSQLTPPAVSMKVDNSSIQVGDTVTVTYTITPGSLGSITNMAISYGDGETDPLTSTSGTLTHSYSTAGAFAILIVASDSSGQGAAGSAAVQVGSP